VMLGQGQRQAAVGSGQTTPSSPACRTAPGSRRRTPWRRAVAVWKMRHDGALSARLKVQIAGASVLATLCKDGDTGMGAGGLPLATSFAPLRRAARSGAVL